MKNGAYIMVVVGILIAKSLGFLRDVVFASVFGASEYTDIYFQIFSVASLVFTGIGGALSTLVIKKLNKPENLGAQNQRDYVAHFITKTSAVIVAVIFVLYLFSGPITRLLLPGLDQDMHHLAVKVWHIMLPSALFVIVAYIMAGVLQNSGVFFVTSIMSAPYNAVIIASLFAKNIDIITVSVVTTIGWFLHIVPLLPDFLKKGYRLRLAKGRYPNEKGTNKEALYIFISSMMFQLVFIIDKASVSSESGAASCVNYASNLFITIASVFVVAMSNVSYPSLCRHFESGDKEKVRKILCYILTALLCIFVPFILVAVCFGTDIISLLYQRGEFTGEMSKQTSLLFAIYSLGIFGYVCQELMNKLLYLDSKYRYTVTGTLMVVLLKPFINVFVCAKDAQWVALSTTVMFGIYALCILFAITKSVGNYFSKDLLKNILKIAFAGAMAVGAYTVMQNVSLPLSGTAFEFLPSLLVCAFVYLLVIGATGCAKYVVKGQKTL